MQDLRPATGPWKPLQLAIRLGPQMGGSTDGSAPVHVQTTLRLICSSKYPRVPPKASLQESRGLSDTQLVELTAQLAAVADAHKGNESIYALAQHVQEFLHAHNRPPAGSLYDEMIHRQRRSADAQRQQQLQQRPEPQQQLTAAQLAVRAEVLARKEMFHNEPKRRELRRSVSEASPTHPSHHHHLSSGRQHRSNSSSDNSGSGSGDSGGGGGGAGGCGGGDASLVMPPTAGGHVRLPLMHPNGCADHRSSEQLYMVNAARRIQRGACLGELNSMCALCGRNACCRGASGVHRKSHVCVCGGCVLSSIRQRSSDAGGNARGACVRKLRFHFCTLTTQR